MSQLKWRCWGLPRCSDDGADTDLGVFGIASDEHVLWLGCHVTFFQGAGATGVESFDQLGIIWEEYELTTSWAGPCGRARTTTLPSIASPAVAEVALRNSAKASVWAVLRPMICTDFRA